MKKTQGRLRREEGTLMADYERERRQLKQIVLSDCVSKWLRDQKKNIYGEKGSLTSHRKRRNRDRRVKNLWERTGFA